ncbi:MAG: hypothetical protein QXU82_02605 [Candidatus Aenigmatarchaeota archaeon]
MPKGYEIGVSSGIWSVAKKEEILGISRKLTWIATSGTNHVQIDLESVNEFKEDDLKAKVDKAVKNLNITFGVHGECVAITGMDTMPLDSTSVADYRRAHDRLMIHVKECSKLGAKYCTIHTSEAHPFILLSHELQNTNLCDFWGRPLGEFLKENPKLVDWVLKVAKDSPIPDLFRYIPSPEWFIKDLMDEYVSTHEGKMPDEKAQKELQTKARKKAEEHLIRMVNSGEMHYGMERLAYIIVAKWMQDNRDGIWEGIVGKILSDNEILTKHDKWVPAVSAKYVWGHFNPYKGSPYEDPKPILERSGMYFCFETPMAQKGYEGYMRLARLPQIYQLVKSLGSPLFGITMDMEHMMSCNIDPKKDIGELPPGAGERLKVVHMTVPTPMNPSHLPIAIGSEAQMYIYQRLYELRKKGFKSGWWIFERGGEEGMIKDTVLAMRLMKKYLEKDVEFKKLPPEFFGMDMQAAEWKVQLLKMKEHALDPLKGMLTMTEEEHGALGTAAKEKGKLAEWSKEKYR